MLKTKKIIEIESKNYDITYAHEQEQFYTYKANT